MHTHDRKILLRQSASHLRLDDLRYFVSSPSTSSCPAIEDKDMASTGGPGTCLDTVVSREIIGKN